MARRSSITRFGREYMQTPGSGANHSGEATPPQEPDGKVGETPGGRYRYSALVLLLVCVGLTVGIFVTLERANRAERLLELRNEIGGLRLEGTDRLKKEDFSASRESFKNALSLANKYQIESPDSSVAAVVEEIKSILRDPAVTRGKSGSLAVKRAQFRKLAAQLEPTDIHMQLGDKAAAVANEHLKRTTVEQLAALVPRHVEKLADRKLAELDEEEIVTRLGMRLEAVLHKRLDSMGLSGLRALLGERLSELVASEIDRRSYDTAALSELLGRRRLDIVRGFVKGAQTEVLAELLEGRFDEIERAVAKKILARQARITLKDGRVWEGQILHDGPLDIRFLKSDGSLFSIPKSRIKKIEKLLSPKDEEHSQPETPGPADEE